MTLGQESTLGEAAILPTYYGCADDFSRYEPQWETKQFVRWAVEGSLRAIDLSGNDKPPIYMFKTMQDSSNDSNTTPSTKELADQIV